MTQRLNERDWGLLTKRISAGRCTPFLGAGACAGVLPLGATVAQKWADEFRYPLEDQYDLARVAQFLAVEQDPLYPKERIAEAFRDVAPPDFDAEDEIHGVLADLPLPVYITTNYDDFMVRALQSRGRHPVQELCRWNRYIPDDIPSVFQQDAGFTPTAESPVVFHLHGAASVPESLVLTEDDYLEFLVNISKSDLLPPPIEKAFIRHSLLFVGYAIADWNFRVLFRSLVGHLGRSLTRSHVSVQLVPGGDRITQIQKQMARDYLDRYFSGSMIRVFWGTCQEFTVELNKHWTAGRVAQAVPLSQVRDPAASPP